MQLIVCGMLGKVRGKLSYTCIEGGRLEVRLSGWEVLRRGAINVVNGKVDVVGYGVFEVMGTVYAFSNNNQEVYMWRGGRCLHYVIVPSGVESLLVEEYSGEQVRLYFPYDMSFLVPINCGLGLNFMELRGSRMAVEKVDCNWEKGLQIGRAEFMKRLIVG